MATFYKGDDTKSIGAPARVLIAAATYPAPTQLSNIIALTDPFAAIVAVYGWEDVGLTMGEATVAISGESSEFVNAQFGAYRRKITQGRAEASWVGLEVNQAAKFRVLKYAGATMATDPVTNEKRTNYATQLMPAYFRVALVRKDEFGKIHATVMPRAQWNGDAISRAFSRGDADSLAFNASGYPDSTIADTNGDAVLAYDLDQE